MGELKIATPPAKEQTTKVINLPEITLKVIPRIVETVMERSIGISWPVVRVVFSLSSANRGNKVRYKQSPTRQNV